MFKVNVFVGDFTFEARWHLLIEAMICKRGRFKVEKVNAYLYDRGRDIITGEICR